MQEVYFLARHIPFWGVPLVILGGEFAYLFWLKKKKANAYFAMTLAVIGLLVNCFYIWAGGPEKSVKVIKKIHLDHIYQQEKQQGQR